MTQDERVRVDRGPCRGVFNLVRCGRRVSPSGAVPVDERVAAVVCSRAQCEPIE